MIFFFLSFFRKQQIESIDSEEDYPHKEVLVGDPINRRRRRMKRDQLSKVRFI